MTYRLMRAETCRTLGAFALASLVTSSLSGCEKTKTDRYKMTVEVVTPSGIKSGAAVREVIMITPPSIPTIGEDRGSITVRGEAIALDIAPGQTLFALMTGGDGDVDYGARIYDRALYSALVNDTRKPTPPLEWKRDAELYPTAPKTVALVNTDPLPLLVRFRNIADPKSVERVEPAALDKAFGPGVKLKRITVQVTDDAVTSGIEGRLKAMGIEKDHGLDRTMGVTANPTLAQRLGFNDFSRSE